MNFLQQETQAGNSPLLPERSGEAAKKKGGTSLCLLNTSQWTRLPIKEYFIKLFDKIASRDALFKIGIADNFSHY